MDGLLKTAESLLILIKEAMSKIDIVKLETELNHLKSKTQDPNIWQDNQAAQILMKNQADLEQRIRPWRQLEQTVEDSIEMIKLNDNKIEEELNQQIVQSQKQYDELKRQLQFSGPFDDNSAILSIHAGAGGTDAQDWAQMLMRMYIRWAESSKYNVKTIEQSVGEEAGIKSVTLEIDGVYAYGKLRSEHGIHRLVRLSPYNSDNLRQTSFAKVDVLPKIDRPDVIVIDDKDLKIDVYRAGGHGGQSVNTTDSAVRITHIPTGIVVAIQNERSQLQNRETALTILRSKLAQLQIEQHLSNIAELKGPNQSAEWGNQIRSYVLHPYKQVKDLRSQYETSDVDSILNGDLDEIINAYLIHNIDK